MACKEYLQLWRIARSMREECPCKTTVKIESMPVGTQFFGLFPRYEPVPLVDHDSSPKIAIELFVEEYNKCHDRPITVDELLN